MDGLLVLDKPFGPSSHDVVARMRRALGERRIGHTGTLDPAATGVLPLVLGSATRLARFLSASDKSYDAVIRLGVATDTADAAGAPIGPVHQGALPSRDAVDRALDEFRGTFMQRPPVYSAKKLAGRRSYALARAGDRHPSDPVPAAVPVIVTDLRCESLAGDLLSLSLTCSAGFYVRALAHDLGVRLGTGAHLASLRRIRSGDFGLSSAITLDAAERSPEDAVARIVPPAAMLPRVPGLTLTPEGVRLARHGRELGPADAAPGAWPATVAPAVRLLDPAGRLVGLAGPSRTPGLLHPSVVLM